MPYSRKDFTGRNLTERTDMSGLEIRGSCFSQEIPDTHVFPEDMTGVTFVNCNLDNCFIPEGNTVIDCRTTRYKVQNDGHEWEIDEQGNPLCIIDWLFFHKANKLHPDPFGIPDAPVEKAPDYRTTRPERSVA
jgi:uncharacterized protein YjbI with pentapeptide repeats